MAFEGKADDLRAISGIDQKADNELLLISGLVDQQDPAPVTPEPLIQAPGLVIAPDRDARYHTPNEITTELLQRIVQRAALAKANADHARGCRPSR